MADRRPLIEGLNQEPDVDPDLEKQFVYQKKAAPTKAIAEGPAKTTLAVAGPAAQGRVPLTVRMHADMAHTLKRASFERQLSGVEPSSMQDIIEEALKPWLRKHGYLP